ncbi:hypothetical protein V2I01_37805 [Micromonospora sp. BRA006-A]|nr:hypothetical protein [Micromonospora sp. BRA006-A]
MRDWLIGLAVAAACLVGSWAVLVLLARRLPAGFLIWPRSCPTA